jgi:tripartite ATP-independent transporter DctM subunit
MAILFVVFFVALAIGFPIAFSLAGSAWLYMTTQTNLPDFVVLHMLVNGMDSFPLLAVPFFILAGNLMNSAGITNRIFAFALSLMGWLRGGLGYVVVVASMIFAGMTGAAVAEAGGLGVIELKALRDSGYDDDFAVGLIGSSATIGPIIPPSLPFVIYGVVASCSVGQLFAAGFLPGILMGVTLMATVAVFARRRNYPRDAHFSVKKIGTSFAEAFLSLLTPVIIIGGMLSGLFTPTEAAVAATFYAMFLGFAVYRTLSLRRFVQVSMETLETTAILILIVGASTVFGWVLTTSHFTELFAATLLGISSNPDVVLLLINLILLVVGCFMETIAAITILVPVFLPLITKLGIDPVHFGLIMTLNLMIGLLTPPVGMVLYILARIAGMSFERAAKACSPFLIPLLVTLAIVTYFPSVSLFLPKLLYR